MLLLVFDLLLLLLLLDFQLFHFSVLYNHLPVVATYLVLAKVFVERPELQGCHLFPADFLGFGVYYATLALVVTILEVVHKAWAGTRGNTGFGPDEVRVDELVGIFPPELALD